MLIRERMAMKRAAQRTERELARKAEEERLASIAARGTGPTRIPKGAVAIAVAKRKPGANYERERQKALARGEAPPAPRAPRYGSLAERAQRTMPAEAPAALPSNMPTLPTITSPAPALIKSVRWRVGTPEGAK